MRESARDQIVQFKALEESAESTCSKELDKRFAAMREERLLRSCNPESAGEETVSDDAAESGRQDENDDNDNTAIASALFGSNAASPSDHCDEEKLRKELSHCQAGIAAASTRSRSLNGEDSTRLGRLRARHAALKDQNQELKQQVSTLRQAAVQCTRHANAVQGSLHDFRAAKDLAVEHAARVENQVAQLQQQAQNQAIFCRAANMQLSSQLASCHASKLDCDSARTILQTELQSARVGQHSDQSALVEEVDRLVADSVRL